MAQHGSGRGDAHVALQASSPHARTPLSSTNSSGWPTTFTEGVEAVLASPANLAQRSASRRSSYSERSSILADELSGFGTLKGGDVEQQHLNQYHGLSSFRDATFNAINVLLGVGVLATPFALRSGGWLVGMPLFFFFLLVTNYTGKLLGRLLNYQEGMTSYPDIGEVAFGPRGRFFISIIFFGELCTACITFYTLIGDTLAALIPSYSAPQLMVIAFGALMPTLWTAHLSMLSWVGLLGVVASCVCFYVVLYVGIMIDVDAPGYTTGSLWHPQTTEWIADSNRIPLSIGLTMVSFAGHSVFPTICSSMADRTEYPRVVDSAYLVTAIIYGAIEICGYLMFGTSTTKEITLNLVEVYPGALITLVVWMIAVIPMSKLPITIHPVALAVEELVLTPEEMRHETPRVRVYRALIRTCIGASSLLCAVFIPHFARLTSFTGSFCAMVAAITFPCAAALKLFGPQLSTRERVLNWFLVVSSIVLGTIGTIGSFTSPAE